MDQNLRAAIQTSTFYYFLIAIVLLTIAQLTTMMVIVLADISGKENVVAASVIGPGLVGVFAIFRMMTNMQYLPFSVLKFVFALIFVVVAAVQLMAIF